MATTARPASSYRGARRNSWRAAFKDLRKRSVEAKVPHPRWGFFWRRPLEEKLNALVHPSLVFKDKDA